MIRKSVAALAALVAILLIWSLARRSSPPEVRFLRVSRQTLVSTIQTNGKVEPITWASARAAVAGTVEHVFIERGQFVRQGDPLVQLDSRQAEADLAAATARMNEARAELQLLHSGGRPAQLSDIDNQLDRDRLDLQTAQRDFDSLKRLEAKQAATRVDVATAHARVEQLQIEIRTLEQRRQNLIAPSDRTLGEAKLHEADAAATLARRNLDLSIVRSPLDGSVYQFDIHEGAYLEIGALVANIGRIDQVRVLVYVDEPDLGRVAKNDPVLITWDALPGRSWRGRVDKPATQISALNTRQVGEVGTIVENPGHDLLPGTNINAEIQSGSVENALTIPKEAIRRRNDQTGVLILQNERVYWRPVELGIATLLRAEVKSGLKEGDSVAGPTDIPLPDGAKVKPVFDK